MPPICGCKYKPLYKLNNAFFGKSSGKFKKIKTPNRKFLIFSIDTVLEV
jgi:hypothetical protein